MHEQCGEKTGLLQRSFDSRPRKIALDAVHHLDSKAGIDTGLVISRVCGFAAFEVGHNRGVKRILNSVGCDFKYPIDGRLADGRQSGFFKGVRMPQPYTLIAVKPCSDGIHGGCRARSGASKA
jgi:hypothetical protein